MSKSIEELKELIIQHFTPHYDLNDLAHRIDHFEDVFQTGLIIDKAMKTFFDPKLILFVAYFHDLFAWSRKNHHDLSHDFILGTDHKLITKNLTKQERKLVAIGCQEHRASRKLPFSCLFGEVMNSADRGKPANVYTMVDRSLLYTLNANPGITKEAAAKVAVTHIKEKFGYGGYASYPECYSIAFGSALDELRQAIQKLTVEEYLVHVKINTKPVIPWRIDNQIRKEDYPVVNPITPIISTLWTPD